jgi:hypothetical protein
MVMTRRSTNYLFSERFSATTDEAVAALCPGVTNHPPGTTQDRRHDQGVGVRRGLVARGAAGLKGMWRRMNSSKRGTVKSTWP